MTQKLFIPEKIRVGYQERSDTYTGRLAYVIYFDAKGKLRKEQSWTTWCQLEDIYGYDFVDGQRTQKPEPIKKGLGFDDYDNVPTEGFVLNKKVGGHSSGWNHRNAYTRVFDPRGFEFEISVENLLFILAEGDCTKGKGLEGKFVYSWDGKDLVLLPVHCNDYKNCQKFTDLQGMKVSAKSLVPGRTYEDKRQIKHVYIGRMNAYRVASVHSGRNHTVDLDKLEKEKKRAAKKSHIFYCLDSNRYESVNSMSTFARCCDEDCYPDFAELLEEYDVSFQNVPIVSVRLEKLNRNSDDYIEVNGEIRGATRYDNPSSYNYKVEGFTKKDSCYRLGDVYSIKNGVLFHANIHYDYDDVVHSPEYNTARYAGRNSYYWRSVSLQKRFFVKDIDEESMQSIVVTLENGKEFVYNGYMGFKLKA